MNTKNTDLSHFYSNNKLLSQKELIEKINKNTASTRKYAELLFWQLDPITNNFRKIQQNGK